MSTTKARSWTPVKGEQFEAVNVGNVTVKLYRRVRQTANGKNKRTIYELSDYTSGVRCLRSFSDLGKARREADKIAGQIASGNTTAATMLNSQAASFGRALELIRPTGATLEMVAATYAKAFEILGSDAMIEAAKFYKRHRADQVTRKPVADVIAELVALKESRGRSADYTKDLRQRLTRFASAYVVDISTITTGDVQRWLDGLKLGTQSVKNFRTVLHTLFEFAEARGYIFKDGNPVVGTERVEVNGGAIEIFTPQEIAGLLKAASPDFLPLVAIGAFAGLRAAEAERIEWRDVDLTGGFIHVASDKAKTKARRLVPIQPNLAQWLASYAKRSGKLWKGTENDLQDARAACVKASGIAWKQNGLRHSYASYRLSEIKNAPQVAMEMGNSADVVFKHYRELVKAADAKAWFAITPEQPANIISLKGAKEA